MSLRPTIDNCSFLATKRLFLFYSTHLIDVQRPLTASHCEEVRIINGRNAVHLSLAFDVEEGMGGNIRLNVFGHPHVYHVV